MQLIIGLSGDDSRPHFLTCEAPLLNHTQSPIFGTVGCHAIEWPTIAEIAAAPQWQRTSLRDRKGQ